MSEIDNPHLINKVHMDHLESQEEYTVNLQPCKKCGGFTAVVERIKPKPITTNPLCFPFNSPYNKITAALIQIINEIAGNNSYKLYIGSTMYLENSESIEKAEWGSHN